ncbi:UNVERIFIED_CONTAM: hypothetical protein GTU68_009336, partial [Idotea baltica]|nr:hypothetical protein [Idotea baltica]
VVSFAPHPRKVLSKLRGKIEPFTLLTPLRRKAELISELGFDAFVCIPFKQELSELSPNEFVQRYLVDALHVSNLVVGDEWRFGKKGAGDAAEVLRLGAELGFEVDIQQQLTHGEGRVSSSRIRSLLSEARFAEAKLLLGRDFDISGRVVHGAKRGRTLGYPTANIKALDAYVPPSGVYATRVLVEGASHIAATNIGVRPVFESKGELLIESHLIGKNVDLYGKCIRVEFVERLRGEQKFSSVDELK